tara:strand:+ start:2272 stop:2964 length:693 start_codon:yes stop_codon:yes gene_type:complete
MADLAGANLEHAVFLKLGSYGTGGSSEDLVTNTIPLKVTSITIATAKTIPSLEVPFSGALSGESITAALDLGMASKSISLNGFILEDTITKKWAEDGAPTGAKTYTAIELAQMIHSSVDSTGLQTYQAINELVFLYDSKVDNNGDQRTSTQVIPFTYASRGNRKERDNRGAVLASTFPTNQFSTGLKGFVRSFNTTIDSETIDISFDLQFEVATVFPSGNIATTIADAIS